jgi:hypothetical protein
MAFADEIAKLGGTILKPPVDAATAEEITRLGGTITKVPTARPTMAVPEFESGQPFFARSEFSRGVARSAANMAGSAADFASIFSDSPKLKAIANDMASTASFVPTKAGNIQDVLADPTLAPAYIGRVTGELAPQAVMAYLTAGAGRALGRGLGAGQTGSRFFAGAGAATTSVPQEVGHMYRETGDASAALGYGVPAGMLDALSAEAIIGKVFRAGDVGAQRQAWRTVVHDAFKQIPKAAGFESATESTQETLALLANRSADETFDLLTPQNGWRVLEAAVAGGIGGGLLGGPI